MWKAVYVSERGTAHLGDGTPCQDACSVRFVAQSVLVAVCADGAGSASHARDGARIACRTFVDRVSEFLDSSREPENSVDKSSGATPRSVWRSFLSDLHRMVPRAMRRTCDPSIRDADETISRDEVARGKRADALAIVERATVVEWCGAIRDSIAARASELSVPMRELACTLVAAIVAESSAIFVQIGDGAIVLGDETGCGVVFWPQSGEYANTTHFLTDRQFEESLQFARRHGRITEFAAFTDGLERLILRFADRTVHTPSLAPMFDALRKSADEKALFAPLRMFLRSDRVNERTNDDKTLILAVRDGQAGDAKAHVS